MTLPLIALTLGDVAGIGPELVVRAASDPALQALCRMVVVGHPACVQRAQRLCGIHQPWPLVSSPGDVPANCHIPYVWNPGPDDAQYVDAGQLDARAGRAAYDYLVAAARAALAGQLAAITTAPLNKAALHLARLDYPGHTEILAAECGIDDFAMMLYLPAGTFARGPYGLSVAHVTLHTSIRSVPELLSSVHIFETTRLIHQFVQQLGCTAPRIGVCALNPHAGEQGLFGNEEATHIQPAITLAREHGIHAQGPIPADALLRRAAAGDYDGVVAMYHDQGHIAIKLLAFDAAVNVTLGLPLIRTSPSHGTAFDIAGRGIAQAGGMIGAVRTAAELWQHRTTATVKETP